MTNATIANLSTYARKVSENGMVFVRLHTDGVLWLCLWTNSENTQYRTLQAVGFMKGGIKPTKKNIDEYFAGK